MRTRILLLLGFVVFLGLPLPLSAKEDTALPPVAMIDDLIQQGWKDFDVKPASKTDDGTWCRRVHLDVIGRIPTAGELKAFQSDRSQDKRAKLVQQLLYDERYANEYAGHWSTLWTNLLIGRSGGGNRRSLTHRDGMQKYLRDGFASNKPYNTMVHDLITATGSSKPGTKGFNGAVNFLIDKVNQEKATLATSSTSRIFLGQQVQCTQCHNHPFNAWKQQRFWEFNSFFRQTRGLRRFVSGTNDIDYAELVDEDYTGEANDPDDALIFFELRNGLTKVAYPKFTDGETEVEVAPSGYVDEVNRRQELAKAMMDSENLDKMIVNRMWSLFLGHGFTRPVDDLGPHNPPVNPELLSGLGSAFRACGYDLKQLITWITTSRPYQLSPTLGKGNAMDDPSIGEPPLFSRFYLRQMSAEQLYASMMTATGTVGSDSDQKQQRRRWLEQFVVAFGTDEGDEATTFNGSIPQALMLFNGDLTKNAIAIGEGNYLDRVADQSKSPQKAVTKLFMAGLSRRPRREEWKVASQLIQARNGNVKEMMQDMWWAILNSNEFILQH